LTAAESQRTVYLPEGIWYDFNTGQRFQGGKSYSIQPALDQIPLFVKAGTILPLATPVEHLSAGTQFDITCYVYGDGEAKASLFEDDGYTFDRPQHTTLSPGPWSNRAISPHYPPQ